MCRALRVLCAAPDPPRLAELRKAATSGTWELVGGASSVQDLATQIDEWRPDVLVLDGGFGPDAVAAARAAAPRIRVVAMGSLHGADASAESLDRLREAILGLPGPGGPVRT